MPTTCSPEPALDASVSSLRIQMFGQMSVWVSGELLRPLRTRKGYWLLALLALKARQPVERHWLAGTLWPDSPEPVALKNLRNSLHDLKQALGSTSSCVISPALGRLSLILAEVEIDLHQFDQLIASGNIQQMERAAALYAGPLLEECSEEWVILDRMQRQHAYLDTLEALARAACEAGQPKRAAKWLRACVAEDPLRESAQAALMSALASAGDYAAATQVYRALRLKLHDELYSQPSSDTTALYERIRVNSRLAPTSAAPGRLPYTHLDPHRIERGDQTSDQLQTQSNLPNPVTTFIGRWSETEQVIDLLAKSRLLTLTGAGGCGKTRLALHVSSRLHARYPDGVWLIELAAITDPGLVPQAVATVANIQAHSGSTITETLCSELKSKKLLLVIDNCEHLIAACAGMAAELLRCCPQVSIIATSREKLGIAGEQTYRVPALTLPDPGAKLNIATAGEYESVRLFVERATLNRPDFMLGSQNIDVVAAICCRLDGMPLAIELAAARMQSLSVKDIHDRINDRFRLLTGGDRTALPRHQTLRALIDWSFDLIDNREALVMSRLSVFAGGFTLEAAENITQGEPAAGSRIDPWEILDVLAGLVDKSLVNAAERDGVVRYTVLETIAHYARERLTCIGECGAAQRRHRDYYSELAGQATLQLQGPMQGEALRRLDVENDNIRAALTCCEEDSASAEDGLKLVSVLWRYWNIRGYYTEGRHCLNRALDRAEARQSDNSLVTAELATALAGAGILANAQADYACARDMWSKALSAYRALHSQSGVAHMLNNLGQLAINQSDHAAARPLLIESLSMFREMGDRVGCSFALNNLGNVDHALCDYPAAKAHHEESLALRRDKGDLGGAAASLHNLANIAHDQHDYETATRLHEESLAVFRELGDRQNTAYALNNLGNIRHEMGDFDQAKALHEESLQLRIDLGSTGTAAHSMYNLGAVACSKGEYDLARELCNSSLAIFRNLDDQQGIGYVLNTLGNVALEQGEYDEAGVLMLGSLRIRSALGDRHGAAVSLQSMSSLLIALGNARLALNLMAAATVLRDSLMISLSPRDRIAYEKLINRTCSALGPDLFDAAWHDGASLTLEQATEYAMAWKQ